jgi:hypothetical protein
MQQQNVSGIGISILSDGAVRFAIEPMNRPSNFRHIIHMILQGVDAS